jgi:DNA-binding LacI/PurR family transcriptional regulator
MTNEDVDSAPKRRKKVTIYDIAEVAGVAPSTVSRTFARPGRVNAETAERIRAAAQKLGYRAKPLPQNKAGVATNTLGFVVADVANPVFAHIMKGFQNEAAEHGYSVLLIDTREDARIERESIGRLAPLVDGIALGASRLSDSAITQVVKVRPVASVNRIIAGLPSIVADTPRGMRRLVEHLASLGHTRFTYLAGPAASWADGVRWRAVSEACHELSMVVRRIGPHQPSLDGGVAAAAAWLEHPTSAVIGYNDMMAIGFMKAVQRAGLRVPQDVSIAGVDNSISSVLTTPTLTSVAPSTSQIGMRAARALITQLRHRSAPSAETIVVPMDLHVRDSVGPARPTNHLTRQKME